MTPAKFTKINSNLINLDILRRDVQKILSLGEGPLSTFEPHSKKNLSFEGVGKLFDRFAWRKNRPLPYLPIEWLRAPTTFIDSYPSETVFHSSGTTASSIAKSGFSQTGLAAYRAASQLGFAEVMTKFFGDDFHKVKGISLIPTIEEMPKSSLATMVYWFSQQNNLCYAAPRSSEILRSIDQDKPCWVFGTAFDFINLIDGAKAKRLNLPKGSVVVETGGTKGKSRNIERADYYQLLAKFFGIDSNYIVSEYGMAELASQAYDWVEPNNSRKSVPMKKRFFRFPCWAPVWSLSPEGHAKDEGKGCLMIGDLARIDLKTPIRTQDLVHLHKDGRFQLLGRAPTAPLKGCSLHSENTSPEMPASIELEKHCRPFKSKPTDGLAPDVDRADKVANCVNKILNSPEWLDCLSQEFASKNCAENAANDLLKAIPASNSAWVAAAATACSGDNITSEEWLVIAPRSHSLATLYPLAIAALLDLKVHLRIPRNHTSTIFAAEVFAELFSIELKIHWADSFRLQSPADLSHFDGVVAYGGEQTLTKFRELNDQSTTKLAMFGEYLCATIIDESDVEENAALIAKDFFSLAQNGCLSSRILFIQTTHMGLLARAMPTLLKACSNFINSQEYSAAKFGPEFLASEIGDSKKWQPISGGPMVALFPIEAKPDTDCIKNNLAEARPFVLPTQPIIAVKSCGFQEQTKEIMEQFDRVSVSAKILTQLAKNYGESAEVVGLGELNHSAWDGTWNKRPLFSTI